MAGVILFMGIVWFVLRQLEIGTKQTNATGFQAAQSHSSVHYLSTQMRRLPCGRYVKSTVELDGPTGVKSTQLLDKDGVTVLEEKKMPVDAEHCSAISHGTFVPELWKDCKLNTVA